MKDNKKQPAKRPALIHIEEYLAIKDIRDEVKAGFTVFMRGREYQYSVEAFDKELEKYFNRKI